MENNRIDAAEEGISEPECQIDKLFQNAARCNNVIFKKIIIILKIQLKDIEDRNRSVWSIVWMNHLADEQANQLCLNISHSTL